MKNLFYIFLGSTMLISFKTTSADIPGMTQANDAKCKNINCPIVENPICVKLRKANVKNSEDIYIIALNECEMEYMQCHNGIEANVMPMNACKHEDLKENNNRVKRSVTKGGPRPDWLAASSEHESHVPVVMVLNHTDVDTSKEREQEKIIQRNMHTKKKFTPKKWHEPKKIRPLIAKNDGTRGSISKNSKEILKGKKPPPPTKKPTHPTKKPTHSTKKPTHPSKKPTPSTKKPTHPSKKPTHPEESGEKTTAEPPNMGFTVDIRFASGDRSSERSNENLKGRPRPRPRPKPVKTTKKVTNPPKNNKGHKKPGEHDHDFGEQNSFEYQSLMRKKSNEDTKEDTKGVEAFNEDYFVETERGNMEDYDSLCPTVCPTRSVMLCAKCSHGVYRTFMSVCHMRMFQCKYTDEEIELFSRQPCIMSAPFLDLMPAPKGLVTSPDDEDAVLRFIRCREKEVAGVIDPKCEERSKLSSRIKMCPRSMLPSLINFVLNANIFAKVPRC